MSNKMTRDYQRAREHRLMLRQAQPGFCRWQLSDGKWFIIGPEGTIAPGNTVMVKSKKGNSVHQIARVITDSAGVKLGVPQYAG